MRSLIIASLNGRGDIKGASAACLGPSRPTRAGSSRYAPHATVEGPLGLRAYVSVLEGNYAAALRLFENQSYGLGENARLTARTAVHILAGDAAEARDEMEKARSLVEARLQERPSDLDGLIQLSWIYLGLDRKSDALKLAQRAADFLPPEKDALVGTYTLYNLAVIKARTGDATGAIDILRRLLAMPAGHEVSLVSLKTKSHLGADSQRARLSTPAHDERARRTVFAELKRRTVGSRVQGLKTIRTLSLKIEIIMLGNSPD